MLAGGESAVYGESLHAHDAFGWAPLRSLRVDSYKYIEAPRPELYNLQSDPHERTNIVAKNPAVFVVVAHRDASDSPPIPTRRTRTHLACF